MTGSLEGIRVVVRTLHVCQFVWGSVSSDCARVVRLEVLFLMGSRRFRGFAVPARLRLSAWASSGPAHRASSVAVPSFAHFLKRLGFNVKGPWVVTTVNKNRHLPSDCRPNRLALGYGMYYDSFVLPRKPCSLRMDLYSLILTSLTFML